MRTPLFAVPLLAVPLLAFLASPLFAGLVVCGSADNDLVKALPADRFTRATTPAEAIDRAADGDGVLLLADRYPDRLTDVRDADWDRAGAKHLRLYVEYPGIIPGVVRGIAQKTTWERAVVAGDAFGDA